MGVRRLQKLAFYPEKSPQAYFFFPVVGGAHAPWMSVLQIRPSLPCSDRPEPLNQVRFVTDGTTEGAYLSVTETPVVPNLLLNSSEKTPLDTLITGPVSSTSKPSDIEICRSPPGM